MSFHFSNVRNLVYVIFKHSKYNQVSGNNFLKTILNTGNYGEYLTFRQLEKLQGNQKILTNVYIPRNNGTTTEIDLLLIHSTGVYVFESKHYRGWIFGDEKSQNWTQSLKGGKKIKFFNPIWQNKGHISALAEYLKDFDTKILHSYIIFSERCELKRVTVHSPTIKVLKRNQLITALQQDFHSYPNVLSNFDIQDLFERLERFTKADEATKALHIQNISIKFN